METPPDLLPSPKAIVQEPAAREVDRWIDIPYIVDSLTVTRDGKRIIATGRGKSDSTCVIHQYDFVTGNELGIPLSFDFKKAGFGSTLSRDGKDLYVSAFYANSIAHVDLNASRQVTMLPIVAAQKIKDDPAWWRWGTWPLLTPDGTKIVVPMGHDEWPDYEQADRDSSDPRIAQRARISNDHVSILDLSGGRPGVLKEVALDDEPNGSRPCMTADSQFLYLTTRPRPHDGTPKLYEVQLKPPYRVRSLPFPEAVLAGVSISERLQKLYVCDTAHRRIWVIDRRTFGEQSPSKFFRLGLHEPARQPVEVVMDEERGLLVAISTASCSLHFLDAMDGRMLARVERLRPGCEGLVITPDGKSVLFHGNSPQGIGVVSIPAIKQKIVFSSDRAGGTTQLYTIDSDGANLAPVFPEQTFSLDRFPAWSPDGRRIAFISNRDIKNRVCLVRWGSSDVRVFRNTTPCFAPKLAWSPDGTRIAYIDIDRTHLQILDVATGAVSRPIIAFPHSFREYTHVCWAEDGRLYATVMPIRVATQSEVFRINPDGWTVDQLTDESETLSSCRGIDIARDGRIAVLHHLTVDDPAEGAYLLHPGKSKNATLELITKAVSPMSGYLMLDWFPHGQKIAFSAQDNDGRHEHICVYDLASGKTQVLTRRVCIDTDPDVSVRFQDLSTHPVSVKAAH